MASSSSSIVVVTPEEIYNLFSVKVHLLSPIGSSWIRRYLELDETPVDLSEDFIINEQSPIYIQFILNIGRALFQQRITKQLVRSIINSCIVKNIVECKRLLTDANYLLVYNENRKLTKEDLKNVITTLFYIDSHVYVKLFKYLLLLNSSNGMKQLRKYRASGLEPKKLIKMISFRPSILISTNLNPSTSLDSYTRFARESFSFIEEETLNKAIYRNGKFWINITFNPKALALFETFSMYFIDSIITLPVFKQIIASLLKEEYGALLNYCAMIHIPVWYDYTNEELTDARYERFYLSLACLLNWPSADFQRISMAYDNADNRKLLCEELFVYKVPEEKIDFPPSKKLRLIDDEKVQSFLDENIQHLIECKLCTLNITDLDTSLVKCCTLCSKTCCMRCFIGHISGKNSFSHKYLPSIEIRLEGAYESIRRPRWTFPVNIGKKCPFCNTKFINFLNQPISREHDLFIESYLLSLKDPKPTIQKFLSSKPNLIPCIDCKQIGCNWLIYSSRENEICYNDSYTCSVIPPYNCKQVLLKCSHQSCHAITPFLQSELSSHINQVHNGIALQINCSYVLKTDPIPEEIEQVEEEEQGQTSNDDDSEVEEEQASEIEVI